MFEVYKLETKEPYMVYGVAPVLSLSGEMIGTKFLFYKEGYWKWENANYYEPSLGGK